MDSAAATPLRAADFPVLVHEDGPTITVQGPTWAFNPKFTFEQFLAHHSRNLIAALRDYASRPPGQEERRLYPSMDAVRQRATSRPHPIRDDLTFAPDFTPQAVSYCIHFDLSERRDATGIAMAHWDSTRERVHLDFAHEVHPTPGQPIRIVELERLVKTLMDKGFFIRRLTADQWGSVSLRQTCEALGIETQLLSVDRTTEPHETLFEAIHSGLLDFYPYPPFLSNLQDLILVKGGRKIDHRKGGAKDCADAVAGAVYTCLKLEGFQGGSPEVFTLSTESPIATDEESPELPYTDPDGDEEPDAPPRSRRSALPWPDPTYFDI